MNGRERLEKMLEEQDRITAAKLAELPPANPPAPRGPDPYAGRSKDSASGREFMMVTNIVADPLQPRKEFDAEEVGRIAASFKTHGQLQPVRVEWKPELGKWQIEDGEKRWMAAQQAGMDRLWCMFIQKTTPADERLEKQLVANALRSGLKPIEQANSIRELMRMKGYTQQQVADRLKMNQSGVARSLQLLELPEPIQEDVIAGKITPATAQELTKLDDPQEQMEVAEKIKTERLSQKDAAAAVKDKKASKGKGNAVKKAPKSVTFKASNGCAVSVGRRRAPTDEEIVDALRETIDVYQKRAAA